MRQICKFDKKRDIQEHVPSLAIDIRKAVDSGVVSGQMLIEDFNNMDIEVAENGTRIREPFDAVDYGLRLAEAKGEFKSGTGNNTPPILSADPTTPADPE